MRTSQNDLDTIAVNDYGYVKDLALDLQDLIATFDTYKQQYQDALTERTNAIRLAKQIRQACLAVKNDPAYVSLAQATRTAVEAALQLRP